MANYDKEFNVKNGLAVNGTVVIDSNGLISPDKIDGGVFPDQTDQSGKFLSTNGSNVLWETVDLTNVDAVTLDGHDSTYFEPANSNIQSHISDTLNPHNVTISQIGAEPANANIQTHISSTSNPHSTTASQVGLGNVTNESKATMFTSPTFTGTVTGVSASAVGLGNVTNESKATMFTNPTFTGTVSGVTATMVGLGNVTNESKATMFTNPTFTGTVSGVTASMVGLGNVTNESKATMFSGSTLTGSTQINSLGVGTTASGTTGEIRATNNVTAYYSDARLKNFEGIITEALDKIKSLNGYYYKGNEVAKTYGYDTTIRQVGVSAQEVQKVLPEIVTDAPIGDGYLTVWYDKLIPLLIEAIKEQQKQIEELRELIDK